MMPTYYTSVHLATTFLERFHGTFALGSWGGPPKSCFVSYIASTCNKHSTVCIHVPSRGAWPDLPGRSGKTYGIVIEAKMRAGRSENVSVKNQAGVSVVSMTSAKTFADEKEIC
jgi:hypothetical protein